MKRNKDVILEPLENRASDHTPRISIHGPSTYYPSNPLRGTFIVGQFCLAKDPLDSGWKSGHIESITTFMGQTTYGVRLSYVAGQRLVHTTQIQ